MVCCDLPYAVLNRDNPHAQWNNEIDMDLLWPELWRVCKPNAAVVLFGQGMFTAKVMMSQPKYWRYNLVWDKVRTTNFLNSAKMPLRQHEDILVFYRQLQTYNPQMKEVAPHLRTHSRKAKPEPNTNSCYGNIKQTSQDGLSCLKYPTSILRFQKKHKDWFHPTEKAVPLLEYLIRTYSNEGDTVLDACMGSGSTGVACVNTNRDFIGIELNEGYFEIAKKRIRNAEIDKQSRLDL